MVLHLLVQYLLTAGTNETFNAVDNEDFVLIVVTGGTGTAATGDIINLNSSNVTVTGQGTNTLVVTSPTVLGNGADVRLVATLTRTVTSEKNKTRNRVQLLQVDNDGIAGGGQYGTSAHHKDISFGVLTFINFMQSILKKIIQSFHILHHLILVLPLAHLLLVN